MHTAMFKMKDRYMVAVVLLVGLMGISLGLAGLLALFAVPEKPPLLRGMVLGEHAHAVQCLAFAPDGRILATASGFRDVQGEIKLWDVATGAERATLRGNQRGIYAMAFAPDGQTLAAVSFDQVVHLWDLATGRESARFTAALPPSLCAALAPDGHTLALAGWSDDPGSVQLWQVAEEPTHRLMGGSGPVCFSADGHRLAVWRLARESQHTGVSVADAPGLGALGPREGFSAAQLWDIPLGRQRIRLCGSPTIVWALAFPPDGQTLATGGFDEAVKLWDVPTGRQRATLSGHADQVGALAFAPDGRLLASGSHDGTVRLWDPAAGQELAILSGHTGTVTCAAIAPDGRWVASGSHDRTVRLWSLANWEPYDQGMR